MEPSEHTLPCVPWELIRLAVADLEACRKDERYELSDSHYHFTVGNKCLVCMAGAVMSQTLQLPILEKHVPMSHRVSPREKVLLEGLSCLSFGDIRNFLLACEEAGWDCPQSFRGWGSVDVGFDSRKLLALAERLETCSQSQ